MQTTEQLEIYFLKKPHCGQDELSDWRNWIGQAFPSSQRPRMLEALEKAHSTCITEISKRILPSSLR